jgi:outer membrane translocation and assembly module TamA
MWRAFGSALAVIAIGCGPSISDGRYGVESVSIRGAEQMDEEAVEACLGTRERPTFSIDFGLRGAPVCGEPPFDGDHLIARFWSWPWEEWPLFDESVFERDVARIERWYAARGFYDARVVATEVTPESAAHTDRPTVGCGEGDGSDCTADVTFTVEEGEPSRIATIAVHGIRDLPSGTREELRSVLQFRRGDRFDEALYEDTKQRMLRVLADRGYADAIVTGEVKINRERREVFVVFTIASGDPGVIGRVCVTGFGELPAQTMLDVAALDAGREFSLAQLEDAQRALYALGVFSAVEVRPRRIEPERPRDEESDLDEEDPGLVGTDPPVVDPDNAEVRVEDEPEVCNRGPERVPQNARAVDIDIRVTPGRIAQVGFGAGLQAGQAVTFGTVTSFADQQDAAQWDIHLSVVLEHRNIFDRLIRGRLEIRPRVVFEMPVFAGPPIEPIPFGVQTTATFRVPAFPEPRTNFVIDLQHEFGPTPYTRFYRSELDGTVGFERTFFDGRLYGGVFLRGNWFFPTDRQPVDPLDELPEHAALWLEESIRVDFRDDPRNPTEGFLISVASQQTVQPLSSWDFVRFTAEARGYIPLPFGIVLAGRFEIGLMEVLGFANRLNANNVYQLAQLGPSTLQLRGGGASSNRGYLPGLMGDVEQVYVTEPRTAEEIASGAPITSRPVRISGGTRLWEASLELRIPITTAFGIVLFADAGDVDRDILDAPDRAPTWRFDHPQFSFGLGLRYRTIVGPFRVDVGVRPEALEVVGGESSFLPRCTRTMAEHCRPVNTINPSIEGFPWAFHLSIGEAF